MLQFKIHNLNIDENCGESNWNLKQSVKITIFSMPDANGTKWFVGLLEFTCFDQCSTEYWDN